MKKIVEKILKKLTSWYLKRHNPEVIAITGSVGKTTTKKAVSLLISSKYKTNEFVESGYNTEIGVPLFILGQEVPAINFLWPITLIKCFFAVFSSRKVEKIVVEMGADKPGDISYLLRFIKPKLSIITAISKAHLEQFKTIDNVLKEKGKLVEILPEDGVAILNYDDERVRGLAIKTKARVITYGLSPEADVYASNIKMSISGTEFTLNLKKQKISLSVKSIGEHSLYSILAAVACGLVYNISKEKIKKIFSDFTPMKGRMSMISGIKKSYLIDDSYNANPDSVFKALDTLEKIAPERKIAVLGTMNELGDHFLEAHRNVGRKAALTADILVTVGDGGRVIAEESKSSGMNPEKIFIEENSLEVGDFLKEFIKPHDTVLFKGSQNNVRLEKAVALVLAEPEKARDVLVRQDEFWRRR